jgi:response regulator of citrate/malate metabolism
MVTASTDRATVEQSLRNGAKGYIVKPFNPGTVMDTLDKIATQIKARAPPSALRDSEQQQRANTAAKPAMRQVS